MLCSDWDVGRAYQNLRIYMPGGILIDNSRFRMYFSNRCVVSYGGSPEFS